MQSIPAVFAVVKGQPIPLFQGALPEAQVRQYLDELLRVAEANGVTGRVQVGDAPVAEAEPEVDPRYDEAYDAIERGDLDAAAAAYRSLLDQSPGDADAQAGLGQVELLRRTQALDERAVRQAAAENPDDVAAQSAVADLDLLGGQVEDAFSRLLDLVRRLSGSERDAARTHLRRACSSWSATRTTGSPRPAPPWPTRCSDRPCEGRPSSIRGAAVCLSERAGQRRNRKMTRITTMTSARMAMVRVFIGAPFGGGRGLSPPCLLAPHRANVLRTARRQSQAPQVAPRREPRRQQLPAQPPVEPRRGPFVVVRREECPVVRQPEQQAVDQGSPEAAALVLGCDRDLDQLEVATEPLVRDHRRHRPRPCRSTTARARRCSRRRTRPGARQQQRGAAEPGVAACAGSCSRRNRSTASSGSS